MVKILAGEKLELPEIPNAKVGRIIELVEKVILLGDASDKKGLAYMLGIEGKSLSNPLRAAELLDFVSIEGNNIRLTEIGHYFERGDEKKRKTIFGKQLLKIEPFTAILDVLQRENEMDVLSFLKLVKAKFAPARKWKEGNEMLGLILNWAEFGRLLSYDNATRKVRRSGSTAESTAKP